MPLFSEIITLMDIKREKDESGSNVEVAGNEAEVFAEIRTIYGRERTQAAADGLKLERKFAITDYYDYNNQHYLLHEGIRYIITEAIRKYESNEMELIAVSMVYNDILTLIATVVTEDDYGAPVFNDGKRTEIDCSTGGAGLRSYYENRLDGLLPEYIFTMRSYDYNNEKIVEYSGKRYSVIKTMPVGLEEIEIAVEAAKGVENAR